MTKFYFMFGDKFELENLLEGLKVPVYFNSLYNNFSELFNQAAMSVEKSNKNN